jgi:hypothetical protein
MAMPGSKTTQKGQRISAAKKGKPLVARDDPNELTRQEAVRETGLSAKVLLEGADRQVRYEAGEDVRRGLRHRRLPHANGGEVIVYDCDEITEDLARPEMSCVYPGCDRPAPGNSGRCGQHAAKGDPPVSLVCQQCGETFNRYGSWLREREGRGRFCSDRCEMLWQRANDARFAAAHAPFDADSAHERYERLGPEFDEARAKLALPLTVHQVAAATYTSTAVIRAHAPELGGKVIEIDGKRELGFPADAPERNRRTTLASEHRARYLEIDFKVAQQRRTVRLLLAKRLSEDQAEAAVTAAAKKRRKAIRRRGPLPASGPSPIDVERAQMVEEARLELQAEHEAGLRDKQLTARAAMLRAAQNIAQCNPRLLPSDYIKDGALRPHYDSAAIALLAKAENACKPA